MEILQTLDVSVPIDPGVVVSLTMRLDFPATLTQIMIDPGFRMLEVRIGNTCVFFARPGDQAAPLIKLPIDTKDVYGRPCTRIFPELDLSLRVERVDKGPRALTVHVSGERG